MTTPPPCTYVFDIGTWPYTNPHRCGAPALMKLNHSSDGEHDPTDEAFTCARHLPPLDDQYWDTRRSLTDADKI